jgi:transposase
MTIQLDFTPEIHEALNYERYHHPVPLVQLRMEALWLKSHGLPHSQIAQLVGVSENTLRDYLRLYDEGGVEKLKELQWHQPDSALDEHLVSLEAYFREHPPATVKEAQSKIEALTGIARSETQVREFLKKKLGLRCRRVGMIPAKADPEVQANYLRQEMQPRLIDRRALPGGVPFQTGGGTARLASPGWVIWAKAPDRFEAGTPRLPLILTKEE